MAPRLSRKLRVTPDHSAQRVGVERFLEEFRESLGQKLFAAIPIGGDRDGRNANALLLGKRLHFTDQLCAEQGSQLGGPLLSREA